MLKAELVIAAHFKIDNGIYYISLIVLMTRNSTDEHRELCVVLLTMVCLLVWVLST